MTERGKAENPSPEAVLTRWAAGWSRGVRHGVQGALADLMNERNRYKAALELVVRELRERGDGHVSAQVEILIGQALDGLDAGNSREASDG